MKEKHTRVLSLLATGIAIELILVAAFVVGRGNSEQWVSTNSNTITRAVGENSIMDSRNPGEIGLLAPEGVPITDEDHQPGSEPYFGDEGTPVFPLFEEDPAGEVTPYDSGFDDGFDYGSDPGFDPDYGGGGSYDDSSYPIPGMDEPSYDFGDTDNGYPVAPTLPPGPEEPLPTDVIIPTEGPTLAAATATLTLQPTAILPTVDPRTPTPVMMGMQTRTPAAATPTMATGTPTAPARTRAAPATPTAPAATATRPPATATAPAATMPAATMPAATMPAATATPEPTSTPFDGLVSVRAGEAPQVDGSDGDPAWNDAPALTIETRGGANQSATHLTVQSVYDDETVTFLLRWADPTESFLFHPWEMQPDRSWSPIRGQDQREGDENVFYEDQFALVWPLEAEANADRADVWQWRAARSAAQADDLYLDDAQALADGAQPDPNSGGGFYANLTEDGKLPAYMPADGGARSGAPGFIDDAEKAAFDAQIFQPGDRLPSLVRAPWQGDRGDVSAAWRYADGYWTLELRRKRITGSEFDVQFHDLTRDYAFSVATFDNTQRQFAAPKAGSLLRFAP
jgi:hypothetical protein